MTLRECIEVYEAAKAKEQPVELLHDNAFKVVECELKKWNDISPTAQAAYILTALRNAGLKLVDGSRAPMRESSELTASVERCRETNMLLNITIWNLIKSAEVLLDQPECKNATYNGNAFMATAVDSLRDNISAARAGKQTTEIEGRKP